MPPVLLGGSKKSLSAMEQSSRRSKAVASYCFGGLLSLFLVVQIITGGFRLIENPLKVARARKSTARIISGELDHLRCIEGSLRQLGDTGILVDRDCNVESLWSQPNSRFYQCVDRTNYQKRSSSGETNGYLMTFANGGLNQMRTAICDMVAVARVMNATLVIPDLDHTSYWDDPSNFEDIFDVNQFIKQLQHDIRIVKTLPNDFNSSDIFQLAPKSWSQVSYYQEEILPLLLKHKVLRFSLTDSRLANQISDEFQRLRCRANYKALRFEPSLRSLGNRIVKRLQKGGSYIALHLRYEKDMLAFSGCTAGLSYAEASELRRIRYNTSRWKEKEINAETRRASGGCPLTPLEIGLLLRALGYPQNTTVYIAAGEIYGGRQRMQSFTALYPNVVTKETLTSPEELKPFRRFQNRLAALDYMVAVESDVFIPTFDGNMARAVQGHRRFLGHRKTLIPDRTRLVRIFDEFERRAIGWDSVKLQVQKTHRNRQGEPHFRKSGSSNAKLEESFYANPLPGCICENTTTIC
ncbi:O-fucosyltransferase 19 [Selaginella moellendorffii]|nr:O-fucosyltransferase 19 [Selaginella moellendorffii]|eukprot:XP_002985158.2 O-fucosyltransferase 19 [Selaginella moellendorffii]